MSADHVVVGRQPIFDRELCAVAYELLFRHPDGPGDRADGGTNGDQMTADVLFGALSIGVGRLVGDKTIFYNADRGALTGAVPAFLPPEQTVIEVLETVVPDQEVLAGCRSLRAAGYRLALDDFVWFEGADELLAGASIVKVDIQLSAKGEVDDLIRRCRAQRVQLLAEKVETIEELAWCMDAGFELFQGYVLARPSVVAGRALNASDLGRLRLSSVLMQDDVDFDAIGGIVRTEPALAFQLMQIAAVGPLGSTRRQVRSIREALVLLGSRRLRSWLMLLIVSSSGQAASDDLITALVRARTCELLAAQTDPQSAAFAFTAGMLSAFDRMLGISADEVVEILSPGDDLRSAAFGTSTAMGRLVQQVIDYEAGRLDVDAIEGADAQGLTSASAHAIAWALHASHALDPSA